MGRLRIPSPKVPTYGDREKDSNRDRGNDQRNGEAAIDENAVANEQAPPIVVENPIRNNHIGEQANSGNARPSGVLGINARTENPIGYRPSGLFSMPTRNTNPAGNQQRNESSNNQSQSASELYNAVARNNVSIGRPSRLFSQIIRDIEFEENRATNESSSIQSQSSNNHPSRLDFGLEQNTTRNRIRLGSQTSSRYNFVNNGDSSVWDRFRFGSRFSRNHNLPNESPRRSGLQRYSTVNNIFGLYNSSPERQNHRYGQQSLVSTSPDHSVGSHQRADDSQETSLLDDIYNHYYHPIISNHIYGSQRSQVEDVLGIYDSIRDDPQSVRSRPSRISETVGGNFAGSSHRTASASSRISDTFGLNTTETFPRIGSLSSRPYGIFGNDNTAENFPRVRSGTSRIYDGFGLNDNSAESSPRFGSRSSRIYDPFGLNDNFAESSSRFGLRSSRTYDPFSLNDNFGSRSSRMYDPFGINTNNTDNSPSIDSIYSRISDALAHDGNTPGRRQQSRRRGSSARHSPYASTYLNDVQPVLLRLISLHERLKTDRQRDEAAIDELEDGEESRDRSRQARGTDPSELNVFADQVISMLRSLPSHLSAECKSKILRTILEFRSKARRMKEAENE